MRGPYDSGRTGPSAFDDEKKHSVDIVHRAKQNPLRLSLMVVSGCYRVPEGEKVERF
ncbi:hypothetical protein LUX12_09630 [Streptomyces somaliensis]|uniref:hypothetical protein n=1 Tax=Streptomyces somaliensis TaxID=78355 RepID=UPI0020CE9A81|nr:hypothetical protein [Streptomyces somaliensis]MCP9944982.1 hypothetical protein [Streptomyces somaliensis]MCP9961796.1 hypothetical protein [Streptomyces somaliensis]MCP9974615.1 hypothetical protein [Streptomyces somaliensis]